MPSGYRYPVPNSDGSFSSTINDFDDTFVAKDAFLNSGLWMWGSNAYGGLGTGNLTHRSSPVQVGSLSNWKYLASSYHILATKTDGTLWTWGMNLKGQSGLGDSISRSSPVQVGTLTNWKLISACGYMSGAIKTNGTLWVWGNNNYGNLGTGTLLTNYSSPIQVGVLTNWKQIAVGGAYAAAIKTDGTLWTWGHNPNGELGLGDTVHRSSPVQVGSLTNWKQVSTGGGPMLAIKTDGTLWSWGFGVYGSLGLGDTVHRSSPVQVGSLTNWKQVSAVGYSSAAIKTDGTLWTWGLNGPGTLGQNNVIPLSSPVQVGSLTNWKQIGSGAGSIIMVIKTDGTLWAIGDPTNGGLGLGNTISRSSPVQVGTLTNWKNVSTTGGFYSPVGGINSAELP